MTSERRSPKAATKPTKEPKLSRTHAPDDLSPVDWQRGLRRQFGREQAFGLEDLGGDPFFSEFRISNPVSPARYFSNPIDNPAAVELARLAIASKIMLSFHLLMPSSISI